MLAFYIDNKPFLLDESASVTAEWVNPAWNFKEFPGDVALNVSIPYNPQNRMLLGNIERYEKRRSGAASEFPRFRAEFKGFLIISGTLVITDANSDDGYSGWCRSEVGNIGKEYREKYITDSLSFAEEKQFVNKTNYVPGIDEYDCPKVYNPDFFSEKGVDIKLEKKIKNPNHIPADWQWNEDESILDEETIPKGEEVEDLTAAFYQSAGWIVNDRDAGGLVKVPTEKLEDVLGKEVLETKLYAISPMLFLNHFLDLVFRDAKFPIGFNFLKTHADLKRLLIYNNFTIVHSNYVTVTTIWENKITHLGNIEVIPNHGIYQKIGVLYFDAVTTFALKNLVPKVQLSEFLLSVQNLANVFFFPPRRHLRTMDVIDRESIFTLPAIDISAYMVGRWKLGEKNDSTLKFTFEHDSNDTYFQDGWENLDDSRDKEGEPVDEWDDLKLIEKPRMGEIRFIKNSNTYAQYRVIVVEEDTQGREEKTRGLGWELASKGFQNGYFNYGQEEIDDIKTKFSTLEGEEICIAEQKGNTSDEHFEYETFSPRLLFSLGNGQAKYETENLRLDWEYPEKGLLAKRWPNTARFWCQRMPVERNAELPLNALDYMVRNIYRRFQSDEGVFVVDKLRTTFRLHQVGATAISGYQVDFAPKVYTLSDVWNIGDIIWLDEDFDFDGDLGIWEKFPLVL